MRRIPVALLVVFGLALSACDDGGPTSKNSTNGGSRDAATPTKRIALPDPLANVAPVERDDRAPSTSADRPTADAHGVAPRDAGGEAGSQANTPPDIAERHKAVVRQIIAAIDANTIILKTVVDPDSARAAAPRLKAARLHMEAVSERATALGAVPRHANALLTTPLGQEVIDATRRMTTQLQRITNDPATTEALRDAMAR